ncbi:hypothetical protein AQUCO_03500228v1 [Aquilegia coerulea]|uniref:Uncharacterized protein n=1 Tax=Aquilegia coerulea TaxID=218851 RepID=A0A2G5CWS7_AQUCA|nr:hypothetical protein AQUCO_03500228v1 [Aquilegia coerulea]
MNSRKHLGLVYCLPVIRRLVHMVCLIAFLVFSYKVYLLKLQWVGSKMHVLVIGADSISFSICCELDCQRDVYSLW